MTGTQTLVARSVLAVAGAVATVALASSRRLLALSMHHFDRAVAGALVATRLGLFALIFLVLHVAPRGDIQGFYFPQAVEVLGHHLPYRDFVSSYAPLHPYLDALFVQLWHSPLSIMLFSVVAEFLLLPLWLRTGRSFLPEPQLRIASLLYLASPISLQFVAVDGQDNVLIALAITFSILLLLRNRSLLSGVMLGVSIAMVKFLPLIYTPAFLLGTTRRWRWAAGLSLVLAVAYGGFLLLHAPILQPLSAEGDLRSAGNLSYVLESLLGITIPGRVSDLVLLLVLGTIFVRIARAAYSASAEGRLRIITFGTCALTLALLFFAKKSWPPYLMLSLFPLCLLPALPAKRHLIRVNLFAFFSFVAVAEHSVWASLMHEFSSRTFHVAILSGDFVSLVFLLLELILLAGYGWLLYEALLQVVATKQISSIPAQVL